MSMLHLGIERLAELVDGGATQSEREHLVACTRCARELDAYRRLVSMSADERRQIAPPLTSWDSLSTRLRDEGLIAGRDVVRSGWTSRWLQRVAAIVVFVAGGAVLGRVSSGLSLGDAIGARMFYTSATGADSDSADVALASSQGSALRSTEEALAQLQHSQRAFDEAAAFLSSHDTSSSAEASEQYRTRLAALDRASATFEQALTDAPRDPILNQYFLATMNAREATMRRLGTTLPVSTRLGRF